MREEKRQRVAMSLIEEMGSISVDMIRAFDTEDNEYVRRYFAVFNVLYSVVMRSNFFPDDVVRMIDHLRIMKRNLLPEMSVRPDSAELAESFKKVEEIIQRFDSEMLEYGRSRNVPAVSIKGFKYPNFG